MNICSLFDIPALPLSELSQTKLTNVASLKYEKVFSSPMSETPIHKLVSAWSLTPLKTLEVTGYGFDYFFLFIYTCS